jgi:hypothetical protein
VNEPAKSSRGQHNWARNPGLFTGACGAIAAVAGVDEFVQASQRNIGAGVFFLAFSLSFFYMAGRMLWTYRRLQKGLGLTQRGLDNLALLDHPNRYDWMRSFYIVLGAAAAGVSATRQGWKFFAGSNPYGTSLGVFAITVAVICFLIAGYCWRQYRNKRAQALRDQL